jgi:hypothetical protein
MSNQDAPTRPHAPIRRSAPVRPNARSNDIQGVVRAYDGALRLLRGILAVTFFILMSFLMFYLTSPIPILGLTLTIGFTVIFDRFLNRWLPSNQDTTAGPNAGSNDRQGVVRGFRETQQIAHRFNLPDENGIETLLGTESGARKYRTLTKEEMEQRRKKEEMMKAAAVIQHQRNVQQNFQRNVQQHQHMHKPFRGPGHR